MNDDTKRILNSIDKLEIFSKDYTVISDIINNVEPETFSVILESILSGEITWADFERVLKNTNYNSLLEESLEKQDSLKKEYEKRVLYARKVNGIFTVDDNGLSKGLAIDLTNNTKDLYKREFENIQDNFIYELLTIHPDDSELEYLCKVAMYKYILSRDNVNGVSLQDLFFANDNFLIPLSAKHIVLDSSDRIFMKQNGLSEKEMIKYKVLSLVTKVDMSKTKSESNENGGTQ